MGFVEERFSHSVRINRCSRTAQQNVLGTSKHSGPLEGAPNGVWLTISSFTRSFPETDKCDQGVVWGPRFEPSRVDFCVGQASGDILGAYRASEETLSDEITVGVIELKEMRIAGLLRESANAWLAPCVLIVE